MVLREERSTHVRAKDSVIGSYSSNLELQHNGISNFGEDRKKVMSLLGVKVVYRDCARQILVHGRKL